MAHQKPPPKKDGKSPADKNIDAGTRKNVPDLEVEQEISVRIRGTVQSRSGRYKPKKNQPRGALNAIDLQKATNPNPVVGGSRVDGGGGVGGGAVAPPLPPRNGARPATTKQSVVTTQNTGPSSSSSSAVKKPGLGSKTGVNSASFSTAL